MGEKPTTVGEQDFSLISCDNFIMEDNSFAASAINGYAKDDDKLLDVPLPWPDFGCFAYETGNDLKGFLDNGSILDKSSMDSDAHSDPSHRSMVPSDSDPLCKNGCDANYKHNDDSIDEYTLANFINDMPTDTKLSSKGPTDAHNLWVFWSEGSYQYEGPPTTLTCIGGSDHETIAKNGNEMIEENIKMALSNFILHSTGNILVQFWRPITVQGQLLLTTLNQPFGLRHIDRKLCEYRIHCKNCQFNVNEENQGVPGRVFLQKWPEFTPNVRYYSHNEYPQWEYAESCSIRRSMALPIFEPFGRGCVGVLEFVDSEIHSSFEDLMAAAHMALKVAKLESSYMYYHEAKNRILEGKHSAAVEIHKALEVVRKTHQLPLVQYWQPCKYLYSNAVTYDMENHCNNSDSSCSEEAAYAVCEAYYDIDTFQEQNFLISCKEHLIRKGQGIVGMAKLVDYKPPFCTDINQLSISNYPLAHYARNSGLTACFAICLPFTYSRNDDHILEVFLPPYIKDCRVQHAFFEDVLATINKNFIDFMAASREEPGEELFVQPFDSSTYLSDQVSKVAMRHPIDAGKIDSAFTSYDAGTSDPAFDSLHMISVKDGTDTETTHYNLISELPDQVSKVAMRHPIDAGKSDSAFISFNKVTNASAFTSFNTISSIKSDDLYTKSSQYSLVSESTLNSTSRKPKILDEPSSKRSRANVLHLNEFGHSVEEHFVESLRGPSTYSDPPVMKSTFVPLTPEQDVQILTGTENTGEHASSDGEPWWRIRSNVAEGSLLRLEKNSEINYHIQESNEEAAFTKNGKYSGAEEAAKNNSEIPFLIPSTVRTSVNPGSERPVVELDASQSELKSMHMKPISSSVQSCGIGKGKITFDDVKKCFGLTLKKAAVRLGVGQSTIMRECRKHNIERWPNRKKLGSSSSLSNGVKKSRGERIVSSDRQISCSDPRPVEVKDVKPMQDASVVLRNEYALENLAGMNASKHQSIKHLDGVGVDEVGLASEMVFKDGEQILEHDYMVKNDTCGAIVEMTVDPANEAALTEQGKEGIPVNKFSHSDDCVDGDEVPRMDIALLDPPKQPKDSIGDPEMAEEVVVHSNAWRGHVVGFDYAKLLHAVEEDHPATFESVQFRTEKLWLSALNSLCECLLKFLVVPINTLSMEDMGSFQDLLEDIEDSYKFILDWAKERLEKVKEWRFGNPITQELANLENRRALLLVEEETLKAKLESLQAERKFLDTEKEAKLSEIYECLGEERMPLITGLMGRGLLPSHQLG